jgi:hypothetical protein
MTDVMEPASAAPAVIPACPVCGGGMRLNTPRPGWFGEHLPLFCETCMQFRDYPAEPVQALIPSDESERQLPTDAIVAAVYLKQDGVTLVAELDYVQDRMPPPRADMAAVLRDLADALDASAEESER